MRVEEWRADEAGAQQRVYDVAHGAVVREADPLGRLHENAAAAAEMRQRGHLGRRGHTAGRSVRGGGGSPGPGFHLQSEASTQAESRSARGEPEAHLRRKGTHTPGPRQRSGRSGSVEIYQRGVKGATVPGVPGFSGASIGRSRLGRPM